METANIRLFLHLCCPQIAYYLGKTYPATPVKQIERDKRSYEVKLDNGFELKFDSPFRMMRMDD